MDIPGDRRPDAHLDHAARIDQPLVQGMEKRRTVGQGLAEIVGPGVGVRVEVKQSDRADAPGQGPQQRQRHRMVAADGQQVGQRRGLTLDQFKRRGDVAQGQIEIADIGHRQGQRVHPAHRIGPVGQHPAGPAHRVGTVPGPGPVGGPQIEGNSGNAEIRRPDRNPGQAQKTRRQSERGRHGRLNRGTRHGRTNPAWPTAMSSRPDI